MTQRFDLVVVGAGSGGIGAAVTAARAGLRVRLIEKQQRVGGTASRAGVHAWEPGVGGTGLPLEIYRRLVGRPDAVGVYSLNRHIGDTPHGETPFPGAECLLDPQRGYADSLRRYGAPEGREKWAFARKHWHGVVFEPAAYERAVRELLDEAGVTVSTGVGFVDVRLDGNRIEAMTLDDGTECHAQAFVDATGDVLLARNCGCPTALGQEARDAYDEPDAPEEPSEALNAVTLVYRVSPDAEEAIDRATLGQVTAECWWRERHVPAHVLQCPAGGYTINMLPTMEGTEAQRLGRDAAYAECRRRVLSHWRHLQDAWPPFQDHSLAWIAPMLGVRETHRIVGRYVLTEHDLLAGVSGQTHDDVIAVADHAMDVHGGGNRKGGGAGELREPYGVPYRCLLPREIDNLLVACRGASFSSIAASSCRLSRTMMQLGQAAGLAAALATQNTLPPGQLSVADLRAALRQASCAVDWPMSPAIRRRIEEADWDQAERQAVTNVNQGVPRHD
jgi:hypothetical protein